MTEWSGNSSGQITLCPLVGYVVNTVSEMALWVRLEHLQSRERVGHEHDSIHFVMNQRQPSHWSALQVAIKRTGRAPSWPTDA
jgi:hypothetical protein